MYYKMVGLGNFLMFVATKGNSVSGRIYIT